MIEHRWSAEQLEPLLPTLQRVYTDKRNPVARGMLNRHPVWTAEAAGRFFLVYGPLPELPDREPGALSGVEEFESKAERETELARWRSDAAWLGDEDGGGTAAVPVPRPSSPTRSPAAQARAEHPLR